MDTGRIPALSPLNWQVTNGEIYCYRFQSCLWNRACSGTFRRTSQNQILTAEKSGKNYQVLTNVEFKKGEVIDIVTKNLTKATLGQLELAEPQEKNTPPKEKAAPAKPAAPTKPAAAKSSPKKAEPKKAEQTEKPKDV